MTNNDLTIIELTEENIESMIYEIRGQRVMLDFDLAKIYGYTTRDFNNQIKHNIERFDGDFRFQLVEREWKEILRWKKTTSKETSSKRRYNPYAFTEQGIYMLMTVLKGELAVKQSKALIRLFKQMKDYLVSNNGITSVNELLRLSSQVKENSNAITKIKQDNAKIKNQLRVVLNSFIDPSLDGHYLFLHGQRIEADVAYQEIYKSALKSVYIVDDYIDIKTLKLLKACNKGVQIVIFTANKAKNSLNREYINDFIKDTGLNITIKNNGGVFHDRYIVIDYKTPCEIIYHCGSSIKDTGNKVTTINKIEEYNLYDDLIGKLLEHNALF